MNINDEFKSNVVWNEDTILDEDSRMIWGKHKGERLGDIPDKYWRWLSVQDWIDNWPALADYIDGLDLSEESEYED